MDTQRRGDAAGIGMARPVVRTAALDEWRLWRTMRLEALVDAPGAFGATYADTLARDDAWWRSWWTDAQRGARFIASFDGADAGMCAVCYPDWAAGRPLLISMWVAPRARGTGTADALLAAAEAWAAGEGDREMMLGVVADNAAAWGLYTRRGYLPTGESEPLVSDPAKQILWMARPLA